MVQKFLSRERKRNLQRDVRTSARLGGRTKEVDGRLVAAPIETDADRKRAGRELEQTQPLVAGSGGRITSFTPAGTVTSAVREDGITTERIQTRAQQRREGIARTKQRRFIESRAEKEGTGPAQLSAQEETRLFDIQRTTGSSQSREGRILESRKRFGLSAEQAEGIFAEAEQQQPIKSVDQIEREELEQAKRISGPIVSVGSLQSQLPNTEDIKKEDLADFLKGTRLEGQEDKVLESIMGESAGVKKQKEFDKKVRKTERFFQRKENAIRDRFASQVDPNTGKMNPNAQRAANKMLLKIDEQRDEKLEEITTEFETNLEDFVRDELKKGRKKVTLNDLIAEEERLAVLEMVESGEASTLQEARNLFRSKQKHDEPKAQSKKELFEELDSIRDEIQGREVIEAFSRLKDIDEAVSWAESRLVPPDEILEQKRALMELNGFTQEQMELEEKRTRVEELAQQAFTGVELSPEQLDKVALFEAEHPKEARRIQLGATTDLSPSDIWLQTEREFKAPKAVAATKAKGAEAQSIKSITTELEEMVRTNQIEPDDIFIEARNRGLRVTDAKAVQNSIAKFDRSLGDLVSRVERLPIPEEQKGEFVDGVFQAAEELPEPEKKGFIERALKGFKDLFRVEEGEDINAEGEDINALFDDVFEEFEEVAQ